MPAVRADGLETVATLKPIIADRAPSSEDVTPLAVPLSVERHREWRFRSDAPKSSRSMQKARREQGFPTIVGSPSGAGPKLRSDAERLIDRTLAGRDRRKC
jgi:hypothetical protein